MITEWINALEAAIESLAAFVLQFVYLVYLLIGCMLLIALICAPFLFGYVIYMDRRDAKAKRRASSNSTDTTAPEPVKGRAPGLSEHASPFGQTEARAERTLEHPPP